MSFVFNGPYPGLFFFIFVLFNHKYYRKTVGVSKIRTRIVRAAGEHADHLTTTPVLLLSFVNLCAKETRSMMNSPHGMRTLDSFKLQVDEKGVSNCSCNAYFYLVVVVIKRTFDLMMIKQLGIREDVHGLWNIG